ncbi:adenine-specific DNA-methyltransferase [Syntrophus gentianae]|uniref:site-specific DNA-methyltransferase (adenine-specific) n=1 Tax=Syntrophus gentianae TaxID=43775 RepID=A0A1H8AGR1_9BACT|nr:site-specific DNA-methyltransferase [Syntrophus gentianae]SEM68707.1 adenine-specific DNA-methyltransferase [Syntrophus gentianae]
MARKESVKSIESITHEAARRKNIPTAEYQSVMQKEEESPIRVAYERGSTGLEREKDGRNRDLDPQLVWRGKDEQDWSDLVVHAPPLYIQEKVKPKVLIDDLLLQSEKARAQKPGFQVDLFADFNGIPTEAAKTEFYQHDANWTNRMILGDSLQVMASLAEREGLRGKVQCIYLDPPYGIKFNSNFQWSTTSRDVKDGNTDHITREPEQVKAFRDTWRDGIHSYLTYLRDRLTVARDLLTESGSIFVQIGDENVHRVRALMDEVFGEDNFVSLITVRKTTSEGSSLLGSTCDFVIWFAKSFDDTKARRLYGERSGEAESRYTSEYFDGSLFRLDNITSSRPAGEGDVTCFKWFNQEFNPGKGTFKTTETGLIRLAKADRFQVTKNGKLNYRRVQNDFGYAAIGNLWSDISGAVQSRSDPKIYVVQTSTSIVGRCILLATDPGDLVLDPTCGSGTTAYVAEQWGRRWITIDTSRVALALARARIMGARYPYYILADSRDGQLKEAEVSRTEPSSQPIRGDIRQGFVYERVPHITLKSIANNAEIDIIWERFQETLEPLRTKLNEALGKKWEEWEIPRDADPKWPEATKRLHADWWKERIARQQEIDASKADFEYLYDKPYENNKKVRVAGPFTVESLLPHRVLTVDENDDLTDGVADSKTTYGEERDFTRIIMENLRIAGVQQAHKEDKISFTAITPWPGYLICADGRYLEGNTETGAEKRAAIFIGPEFGTVSRPDLVSAAREAGDADFDVLITCAFNYDAHSSEFNKLGRIPVLKARMNADLHMADDLKNTGKGNLFVIFGEPDIDILETPGTEGKDGQIQVKINGVDVFHPNTGEVRSDGAEGIACWFIDTDYNEESFFVRHAYFLGANDPYKSLKITLKAEINEEAWATLHSDTSRPFDKPTSGRIAVKVINHLGDEVMKVFRV